MRSRLRPLGRAIRARALAPLAIVALTATAGAQPSAAERVPRSAGELVARMREKYGGRWFRTLTFVQKTTLHRPDGTVAEQTWLEAMEAPSRLRIDIGPRSDGNGIIFTADSTYRVRGGKLAEHDTPKCGMIVLHSAAGSSR